MIQAIGPVRRTAAFASSAPAFASLQAQLQRYEQQLSECVNCATAKTPKGKANIDSINAHIGQVKANMAQAGAVQRAAAIERTGAPAPDGLGARIDVYA